MCVQAADHVRLGYDAACLILMGGGLGHVHRDVVYAFSGGLGRAHDAAGFGHQEAFPVNRGGVKLRRLRGVPRAERRGS